VKCACRLSFLASCVQSNAHTVSAYLAELPPERRIVIEAVRGAILQNLDHEFVEGMQYGMIGYFVPHSIFPAGYHCDPKQPLPYAGLASQKNACSLYLMSIYADTPLRLWFVKAWMASGRKLDMGKSCIRFKSLDELPLDVVGEAIRRISARRWIEIYEQARASNVKPKPTSKPSKKASAKPTKKQAKKAGAKTGMRKS
jgi:Domain of unknown function (DU1801)